MLTTDFSFSLPEELIAQVPAAERGASRLLVLDRASGAVTHSSVRELATLLPQGATMVFNDSRVRKARLFAATPSGGKVEVLLLRRELSTSGETLWAALTTRMAKLVPGKRLSLPEGLEAEVVEARPDERVFRFSRELDDDYLERNGHLPLPPYIRRADAPADADRYQTVYSREQGSAAAPTAGLHFTPEILDSLRSAGIDLRFVTLHVGLGTFLPVRAESLEDHRMHRGGVFRTARDCRGRERRQARGPARHRRRHDERPYAGKRLDRRRPQGRPGLDQHLHLSRIRLQGRRRHVYQLPYAGIDAPHARLGIRRARAHPGRL